MRRDVLARVIRLLLLVPVAPGLTPKGLLARAILLMLLET
jgi:hypothetical protein